MLRSTPGPRWPSALSVWGTFRLHGCRRHLMNLDLEHTAHGGLWAGGEATLGPLYRLSRLTQLDLCGCLAFCPLLEELSCLVALVALTSVVTVPWYVRLLCLLPMLSVSAWTGAL